MVTIAALIALVVAVYPSIRVNSSYDTLYQDLSPTLQALLGGSNLTSPAGYLSTQLFAFFLPAVVLIFAIGRGAEAIAGEEEQHTLDLLLAQPLSRRSAYLQKSAAVVAGTAAMAVASWIPLVALDSAVRFDLPVTRLTGACLQLGLFSCALALGAQAVAAAAGRRTSGIAVAVGYAVSSYFVYGLSMTVHPLSYLRPFTLWRWYLANDPLHAGTGSIEVAVLLGVCVVFLIAGAAAFDRRDLRA